MSDAETVSELLELDDEPEPSPKQAESRNGNQSANVEPAAAEKKPPLRVAASKPDVGLDDIGNAARFAQQHADKLRFVPDWGNPFTNGWMVWDGRRWARDDQLEHVALAKLTARCLFAEIAELPPAKSKYDEDRQEAMQKHAARSQSEPKIRAMLRLAAADERLRRRPADFDCNPWALNTPKGIVDLRDGEPMQHSPDEHFTRLAGVGYEREARCPRFDEFLLEVLVEEDKVAFVQRLVGYSAIGLTREHILPILFGTGRNGKSVFRNVIAAALGDYAHQSTVDLLMQTGRDAGRATPELADLRGRRLVTVSETREDGRLASERVKAITGGEPITARFLNSNPFTFDPSHTVWLSTNHRPRVPDDGDAIWHRLLLVPFTVTIPEDQQDKELGEKLIDAELAGVLRWIVEGAIAYLAEGLNPPDSVRAATATYRKLEDQFGAFLEERTITDQDGSVAASDIRDAYNTWAGHAGATTLSSNAIADKLAARGYDRRRPKGRSRWYGLRLTEEGTLDA